MNTNNVTSDRDEPRVIRNKPPFKLLRYFTLISIATLLITSVVFGTWFSHISAQKLIKNEERNNVALARTLSSWVWPQYGDFLSSASQYDKEVLKNHQLTNKLDKALLVRTSELGVLKIKIYDLQGYTVFSSDRSQIGSSKKGRSSFEQAKTGTVISNLAFRDKIYARKEFIENRNVLSSYIPVYFGEEKNIVAVLEIYKDVSSLVEDLEVNRMSIISAVITGLLVLFAVLYFVIRHADRIIITYNQEQLNNHAHIHHQAYHDYLTGLPNRMLLLDRLEHAMLHAQTESHLIALMFIDLDRFKQINDTLGHDVGDDLLIEIAKRIKNCTRPADTVARLAGDEFIVILEGLQTVELAQTFAERIIKALEKPVILGAHKINITCSIGIALYPFEDDNSQSLLQKADTAMYFAKHNGRNNYHLYTVDSTDISNTHFTIENDLINALENNQFVLHFQPKIDLNSMSMCGMEALIRWEHPEKGTIPPLEFIPALEESGLIHRVGLWVIERACKINKQWIDTGLPPLQIAVNISTIQLNRDDFVDNIFEILDNTGLDPKYLELELTESGLLSDIDANIIMFEKLRAKGIKLALDDFGTGYSSLSYICKLPIDIIKIDKEFIHQITSGRQTRSVVTAILSFAHGLRLDIVAEGVETTEQLVFLNAMRCTTAQGFLLSKPLPQEEFESLYRRGTSFEHIFKEINKQWQT